LVLTYTVTFNSNGGTEIQPIAALLPESKITKPDDPIKPGFVFDNWYKDDQYSEAWDFDTDIISDNITLYAKWFIINHIINFDADGGTVDPSLLEVNPNSTVDNLPIPTKNDYDFDGWYTEKNGNGIKITTDTKITGDITIYANWKQKEIFVSEITLNKTNSFLLIGEIETLTPAILPVDAWNKDVLWTSSDDNIVMVSNGIVTANSIGSAVIKVSSSNGTVEATCNYIVKDYTSIIIRSFAPSLYVGETVQLSAYGIRSNNVEEDISNFVVWDLDDTTKATLTTNNNLIVQSPGTVVVTIKFASLIFDKTITLHPVAIDYIGIYHQTGTGYEPGIGAIAMGQSIQLVVIATYTDDHTEIIASDQCTWSTTFSALGSYVVSINSDGVLYAMWDGSDYVTVKFGVHSAQAIVSVIWGS
jgi:uncharacterized repeat protein (TIGR02543 family)